MPRGVVPTYLFRKTLFVEKDKIYFLMFLAKPNVRRLLAKLEVQQPTIRNKFSVNFSVRKKDFDYNYRTKGYCNGNINRHYMFVNTTTYLLLFQ